MNRNTTRTRAETTTPLPHARPTAWSKPRRSTSAGNHAVAICLVLVVSLLAIPLASPPATAATTDRVLAITQSSAAPSVPFANFDAPVKLFDVDGDGDKEIIAQNENQWVYVFDSQSGRLMAELKSFIPSYWGARSINAPEAAVIEEGGPTRVVVANSASVVAMFRFDGYHGDGRFRMTKEWEVRPTICFSEPGMDARPVLADLNKDGRLDVLIATEESGVYAVRHDGVMLWHRCLGGGNAEPAVADLDLDGFLDVVHVSDGGFIAALDGRTGAWKWGYNILSHFNLGSASIPVSAGIGQLDGKGGPDIVVGARDSHNPNDWSQNHALVLALDSWGKKLWSYQDPNGNPLTYTHPVIVDTDRNGVNEVYWGDWNTVGHKPPAPDSPDAWKHTGDAHFYRFANNGQLVWRQSLPTQWSNKDVPLADVDGDGIQEMLASGQNGGHDGIWYLDSRHGGKEAFVSLSPWKAARAPVVADLWGGGTMQWVLPAFQYQAGSGGPAILVYDTHAPYSSAWPGAPSATKASGGSPPPPDNAETFAATFTTKAQNEWWQELYVQPSDGRAIVDARVRVNDGTWMPMSKSSWGAWTSSYNAKAGSQVVFRATSSNGATSTSEAFTWLDGTNTRQSTSSPSPPPDESGSFAATYTTKAQNAWWQEVYIKPDGGVTVAQVWVKVGADPWRSMAFREWGAWTSSIYAPSGTQVSFLAKSTNDRWSQSQPFTWLDGTNTRGSVPAGTEARPDGGGGGGGGAGAYDATYAPSPNINTWWVEVSVKSSPATVRVEAQVNGGSWTNLPKTDWGTWAKSFHVPSGSQVVFRSFDASGASDQSSAFTWP